MRQFLVCALAWTSMSVSQAQQYFVSSTSNDDNPGTLQRPFETLKRAQSAVREKRGTVTLRGGTYYLSETLSFTSADSGTKDSPVVYQAYGDEEPVISGGVRLTNLNWQPFRFDSPVLESEFESLFHSFSLTAF